MNLVFVHGRAQGLKDPIELKKEWINTLKIGLEKSGLTLPISEENISFPFYGEKLDDLVRDGLRTVEGIITKGAEINSRDVRFFQDFLLEISENADISTEEISEANDVVITEKGPLNWPWVQAILRTLDQRTRWSEASIKRFTRDVVLYLTAANVKDIVNNEVMKSIKNKPCVVVGHSLGSIICYNILRDNSDLNICKFITIGSPLGLKSVKNYLRTPIKMPDCIKHGWYNAYDERDVVALNPLDRTYFNISPSIENDNHVRNSTSNRHGIRGYLNDKVIAKTIYNALRNDCT
jgi:hypothetical protein